MQSNTLTPFQLFGSQVRYVVPIFQRPYVWTLEDQWEPLWNDIRTVAERLLESSRAETPEPNPWRIQIPPHFLGAMVLDQQLVPSPYTTVRHVIDGQQRLTTLQLLLDAAQWVVQQHGGPADASALQMLILNNPAVLQNDDEIFKVWPSHADCEVFRAVMKDDLSPTGDLLNSPIAKAHAFFAGEIEEWADLDGDPEKVIARLHALTLTLTQQLKMVVIDLDSGDNAQVIFETLNYRGTPLLAADLVKNWVFQLGEAQGADVHSLYSRYWAPFDTGTWRRKVKQGRLYRPRIDVFLNYWLAMRKVHEVPTDRVFSDFREYLIASDQSIENIMDDMASMARVFDGLERWQWTSVEGTFFYRLLQVMEQFAFGPLLLWLLSWPEERLSLAQRRVALRSIESWAVRRMICRLTFKQVNQLVIDLLRELVTQAPETAGDFIAAFLGRQEAETRRWPTDDEVRASVEGQPLYTAITRGRLRMILEAIEDQLRSPLAEEQHCLRGGLTIEHVIPQEWREHWLLPPDGDPEKLAFRRDGVLHTLANLTLVTGRLNSGLSNRPWTDEAAQDRGLGPKGKRSVLAEHSVLHLNKRILKGWAEAPNEDSIAARAAELGDLVVSIWPASNVVQSVTADS